eukprot:8710051-Heterocapsa_arctica.AAC.1
MARFKAVTTPFAEKGTRADVDITRVLTVAEKAVFLAIIGKMIWMINDRPDIAYAEKELARTVQQPTVQDMMAAKRVLRYLIMGTMNTGLYINIDRPIHADQVDVMVDA